MYEIFKWLDGCWTECPIKDCDGWINRRLFFLPSSRWLDVLAFCDGSVLGKDSQYNSNDILRAVCVFGLFPPAGRSALVEEEVCKERKKLRELS